MNVRLAAQTLSSSVANAIEFLEKSLKLPEFQNSNGTVEFLRTIDKLFDMLNSRNPLGNGFKTPLKLVNKSVWEEIFTSSAHYLLSLKTDTETPQLLSKSHCSSLLLLLASNQQYVWQPKCFLILLIHSNTCSRTSFHKIM